MCRIVGYIGIENSKDVAIERGFNVDQPRNLTKSVKVE